MGLLFHRLLGVATDRQRPERRGKHLLRYSGMRRSRMRSFPQSDATPAALRTRAERGVHRA